MTNYAVTSLVDMNRFSALLEISGWRVPINTISTNLCIIQCIAQRQWCRDVRDDNREAAGNSAAWG